MLSYIVYIILCEKDKLYTGFTKDMEKRWLKHTSGKGAKFTRMYKPVKILHTETFTNITDAMRREREIKKMSRIMKVNLCGASGEIKV